MSISLKNDAGTFSTNLNQSNPTENLNLVLPTTSGTMATTAFATSQDLGVGQTWQDVKASRALDSTYTNNTGKPIVVHITVTSTSPGGSCGITVGSIFLNGTTLDAANVWIHQTAIVPNGSTYSVTLTGLGTKTILNWSELR
jgi:hypothetical protein